jgi:TetR/AcrR family transcriptional regulator
MNEKPAGRLTNDERRESILEAATVVFGERGYHGATTDAIASAAGISQAYVVRMFGSKEELFIAAGGRAVARVLDGFRAAIATFTPTTALEERKLALAAAYSDLVVDRGLLLTLMHFYGLGHDPVLGPLGRESYLRVFRVVRDEAGFPAEEATAFFAKGMLINVLVALRISDVAETDDAARDLLTCTMHGKEMELIALSALQPRLAPGRRA